MLNKSLESWIEYGHKVNFPKKKKKLHLYTYNLHMDIK